MFGRANKTLTSGNHLGLTPKSSPLEGLPSFQAQAAEQNLERLGRREWWLWFSALTVTTLSAAVLLLSSFSRLFQHREHFYELRPEQARWGILCLLLVFNVWTVYRQRSFRRARKAAKVPSMESGDSVAGFHDPSGLDPVTSLFTRASALQYLAKEIARAKRQNTALSLATVHLEDMADLYRRFGSTAVDQALKEFAGRLKEVSRGSDYAVRLADDDFVLVLPKCNIGEVRHVLDRVGAIESHCAGKKISLEYTTGWVDYQSGDTPSDLLKRASQLLQMYGDAANQRSSATGTAN